MFEVLSISSHTGAQPSMPLIDGLVNNTLRYVEVTLKVKLAARNNAKRTCKIGSLMICSCAKGVPKDNIRVTAEPSVGDNKLA